MQRLVSYLAAAAGSALGWKLGAIAGPAGSYFLAVFAAAGAMYATRRWLRSALG